MMDAADRKEILVKMVKAAGQELINRAEDFVGDTLWVTDMNISIGIPVILDEAPYISVNREFTPNSMIEALTEKYELGQCSLEPADLGGE